MLEDLAKLQSPDGAQLKTSADAALRMVASMTIETDDEYQLVSEELLAIKSKLKSLEEKRTSITGPINKALDAVNNLFRGPRQVLEQAEARAKSLMLDYTQKKERAAAEQRAAAEAAARIEAERRRREADDLEAKARQAEERAKDGDDAAAEEAAEEAQALAAHAAEVRAVADVVAAPVVPISKPKAAGVSTRKTIDYEVTSLIELIQHVAANPELVGLLMVDSKRLGNLVKATGMNTKLPGVRVFERTGIAARAA